MSVIRTAGSCASLVLAIIATLAIAAAQKDAEQTAERWRCNRPVLANGRVQFRGRGRLVRYRCRAGYQLHGDEFNVCVNRAWLKEHSVCTKSGCQEPAQVANSVQHRLLEGAVRRYSCRQGYSLSGETTIFCDGNRWNGSTPMCSAESVSCNFDLSTICGWKTTPVGAVSTSSSHRHAGKVHWKRVAEQHSSTSSSLQLQSSRLAGKYYMQAGCDSSVCSLSSAQLTSPVLMSSVDAGAACLVFWYLASGTSTAPGAVEGVIIEVANSEDHHQYRHRWIERLPNTGHEKWQKKQVKIFTTNATELQVVFHVSVTAQFSGTVSVDDVVLLRGRNCDTPELTEPRITESSSSTFASTLLAGEGKTSFNKLFKGPATEYWTQMKPNVRPFDSRASSLSVAEPTVTSHLGPTRTTLASSSFSNITPTTHQSTIDSGQSESKVQFLVHDNQKTSENISATTGRSFGNETVNSLVEESRRVHSLNQTISILETISQKSTQNTAGSNSSNLSFESSGAVLMTSTKANHQTATTVKVDSVQTNSTNVSRNYRTYTDVARDALSAMTPVHAVSKLSISQTPGVTSPERFSEQKLSDFSTSSDLSTNTLSINATDNQIITRELSSSEIPEKRATEEITRMFAQIYHRMYTSVNQAASHAVEDVVVWCVCATVIVAASVIAILWLLRGPASTNHSIHRRRIVCLCTGGSVSDSDTTNEEHELRGSSLQLLMCPNNNTITADESTRVQSAVPAMCDRGKDIDFSDLDTVTLISG